MHGCAEGDSDYQQQQDADPTFCTAYPQDSDAFESSCVSGWSSISVVLTALPAQFLLLDPGEALYGKAAAWHEGSVYADGIQAHSTGRSKGWLLIS